MKTPRVPLAIALLSLALVLLTFLATNLVSAPIWLLFRRAAGLETVRSVMQVSAFITMLALFVAALVPVAATALEPAGWLRKLIHVLPLYLLGLTAAAVLANMLGFATMGSILSGENQIKISLATAWLGLGAALSAIAVTITVVRARYTNRVLKTTTASAIVALVAALALCAGILAAINIVEANRSSLPQGAGGPGETGGVAGLVSQFETGGALMAVFGLIALGGTLLALAWRRRGQTVSTAAESMPRSDYAREAARALVGCVVISLILGLAIQAVPVPRDNPPARGVVAWDSPQTKDLVSRACMNCHSNETAWPWYASVAPGSWITAVDVMSARRQFNLSELTNMTGNRKTRLARDMADQIRNGTMPPADYLIMHPEARLSIGEKEQLVQGLLNSLK